MKKKLARALSARIETLRETAGLSQQEVAARGDLSVSLVAKLEQGKKANPRASTLLALARALGVTPGALLDDLLPAKRQAPEAEEVADEPKAEAPPNGAKKVATKKKKVEA
jgi:transcriptional regulator with XRE-family HTH domain